MFKGKKTVVSREDVLNSLPLKNESLEYARNDQGEISVTMKRRFSWWLKLFSAVFYVADRKTLTLDRLGSEVLELCDGSTTFRQMVETFSARHKLNYREAEASITAYLRTLGQRGIVAFAIKQQKEI